MRPSNDLPAVYLCREAVDFRCFATGGGTGCGFYIGNAMDFVCGKSGWSGIDFVGHAVRRER